MQYTYMYRYVHRWRYMYYIHTLYAPHICYLGGHNRAAPLLLVNRICSLLTVRADRLGFTRTYFEVELPFVRLMVGWIVGWLVGRSFGRAGKLYWSSCLVGVEDKKKLVKSMKTFQKDTVTLT